MNQLSEQHTQPSRTMMGYLGIAARGAVMGAADVVPGVSGGTMAFILGIYEELIRSIRVFTTPDALKLLVQFQLKHAAKVLPWRFLAALGSGILAAIFSLAHFLEWALEHYPALLWAFFFGLVVASILTVLHRVQSWDAKTLSATLTGTVCAYLLVGMVPTHTPDAWWFFFLSGAIAICAMILPGISGSFILVLLGKYQDILAAVTQHDVLTLFWVGCGTIIGLATFARVLSWLFGRYHDVTIAVLIGFMAGSLRKIWPWKETLQFFFDRHGEAVPLIQKNVLPELSGEVGLAIGLALLGAGCVFLLSYPAKHRHA
jgi:putative membrane protein